MQTSDELRQLEKSFDEIAFVLREDNKELMKTVEGLQWCCGQLEIMVKECTAELARTNEILKMEIIERKRTKKACFSWAL
jgi:hypothetical protein